MNNQDPIDITEEFKKMNSVERRNVWAQRKDAAINWCKDHKGFALGAAITLIEFARTIIKVGGKVYQRRMDMRSKDFRCYDTSLGRYWELNRKLSNKDWLEIDRRRSKGERLGDILNDIHALK